MAKIKDTKSFMRITHRYLGFFMAGIMTVYAVSGVLLIYRDTDFLKKQITTEKVIESELEEKELGKALSIKNFEITKTENGIVYFKQGFYNKKSGASKITKSELPILLKKMTNLHKSQSKDRFSTLNAFFGVSLFFFVISSFWMFNVRSKAFKRGMLYSIAGIILSIVLIYFT